MSYNATKISILPPKPMGPPPPNPFSKETGGYPKTPNTATLPPPVNREDKRYLGILSNQPLFQFYTLNPDQFQKDLKSKKIEIIKDEVLGLNHLVGSFLVNNPNKIDSTTQKEYHQKVGDHERKANELFSALNVTLNKSDVLSKQMNLYLSGLTKQLYQINAEEIEKLFCAILVNLNESFFSENTKNKLEKIVSVKTVQYFFDSYKKSDNFSTSAAVSMEKKPTETSRPSSPEKSEDFETLHREYNLFKLECQMGEIYAKALIEEGIEKIQKSEYDQKNSPSESELFKLFNDQAKKFTDLVIVKMREQYKTLSTEQVTNSQTIAYQFFSIKIIKLLNSQCQQWKQIKEQYEKLLIDNIKKRPKLQFETIDSIRTNLKEDLFDKEMKTKTDPARALKIPSVHMFMSREGKLEAVDLDTPSKSILNVQMILENQEDWAPSEDKMVENRFFNMLSGFSDFFFNNSEILSFLALQLYRLNDLETVNNVAFEKFYEMFYFKLISLSDGQQSTLKTKFQEKYPKISLEKALRYLKLCQNMFAQNTLYLVQDHVIRSRAKKFKKDKVFLKGVPPTIKPNKIIIRLFKEKDSDNDCAEFTYVRNGGLVLSDVVFHTEYTLRYFPAKDQLAFPVNLLMTVYCPHEKKMNSGEDMNAISLANQFESIKSEDFVELRDLLFDLPLITRAMNFGRLNIAYEAFDPKKEK